jgi:hypothetical protein
LQIAYTAGRGALAVPAACSMRVGSSISGAGSESTTAGTRPQQRVGGQDAAERLRNFLRRLSGVRELHRPIHKAVIFMSSMAPMEYLCKILAQISIEFEELAS